MLTSGANVITGRSWGVCGQFIDVDGKSSRQPLRLTSSIKPLSLLSKHLIDTTHASQETLKKFFPHMI